jgi:hypothetical protein
MSIMVDGKEFAAHEIRVIDGRPTLVVKMGPIAAPVVNGVEYHEFECHIANGEATLRVPFGEKLPEADQPQSDTTEFAVDFGVLDEMDLCLDRIANELGEHQPESPLALVVDIEQARTSGPRTARKPRNGGPSRTNFTRRPLG